jgi:3',5'-cyclic AMP phosphodiesterase CpdA
MRLAHVSDLHIFSLQGTGPLPFLGKRLAGLANMALHRRSRHPIAMVEALLEDLNRVRPDEVVITGDVTNLSLEAEFKLARSLLDRIEIGVHHVTVVPGNHDVYTVDAMLRRPFHHHLRPYVTSDSGDEDFPVVRVRDHVALVGLSSARPSPVPFASGSLGARQRDRLEQRLVELGKRGLFRVVLMHHPPVDNRTSALRGLRDRSEVQAVLRRAGAELVVHGHEHRDLVTSVRGPEGPIPVCCVGSASYDHPAPERRARYHLYEIAPGVAGRPARIVSRSVRAHDGTRFEAVSGTAAGSADGYWDGNGAYSNDQPPAPHTALRG